MDYLALHKQNKELSLSGRYIALKHIEPLLSKYPNEVIGKSVKGKPIYKLAFGTGKTKILMWSQMHGKAPRPKHCLISLVFYTQKPK